MVRSDSLLRGLLYGMLRIRLVEEGIAGRYAEQEMRCPVHLCIGQEAIAVGVCAHLEARDRVLSGHRSHGHYLAKGGDLKAMMAEIYGRATGCSGGKGGSMHLIDLAAGFLGATPIVASTIPIAVGTAFAASLRRERTVSVVFFGEGATEEGAFHESVNFAVLKRLPIVFVCENNLYSVYSPMSVRQPEGRSVVTLAAGHGIESHQADGNDVGAVHALAGAAVEKARAGGGPTFLEFATYRWREHCGPLYDNEIGYRTEREFEEWTARCPIQRLSEELRRHGVVADREIEDMTKRIREEFESAVLFARASPYPEPGWLTDDVYAG
jgi:TPP-dependent pyruvate/acetoin dehydrogenase alpha subunit